MASRYDNSPKPGQKRSQSDPTMTQQKNSAESKKAGEDVKKPMSGEPDMTDPKGPTPDLDAGTDAVPVTVRHTGERADMYARHAKEMQSTHTQYEKALRDMRSRHEADIASMMKRHEGEAGSPS